MLGVFIIGNLNKKKHKTFAVNKKLKSKVEPKEIRFADNIVIGGRRERSARISHLQITDSKRAQTWEERKRE